MVADIWHTIQRKFHVLNAQLEAYLSSHAFHILFLEIYVIAVVLTFVWGAHDEFYYTKGTIEKDHPNWKGYKWYIAIARGAGFSLNLNCSIVLFLTCRKIVTWIRHTPLHKVMPLDKSFPTAHIIVGWTIMIAVVFHVIFHSIWLIRFSQFDMLEMWSFSMTVLVGCLLLLVFSVMFATATPLFRNKKSQWRIFYVIHLVCAFLFYGLLLLHGLKRKKPETWLWVLPALIVYTIDRCSRRFSTKMAALFLDKANSKLKSGNILELRIRKPFNYKAGQFVEIAVPELGTKEWHPFSIASAPHEKSLVVYIKVEGDWCTKLRDAFQSRENDVEMQGLLVKIRGPYGAPAQHTGSYKHVVLVSGGIGATPFVSIAKELHHRSIFDVSEHAKLAREQSESATRFVNEDLLGKLRTSIDYLYGYGSDVSVEDSMEQFNLSEAKKRAQSLQLDSFGSMKRVLETSNASDVFDADPQSTVRIDVESNIAVPKRVQGSLEDWDFRKRLLSFLQSTRVTLGLLTSMLVRFALVCILAIWNFAEFRWQRTSLHLYGQWAVIVDTVLGLALASIMLVVIVLEISFMKSKFFIRTGRVLDFFISLPLAITSAFFSIKYYPNPVTPGALTIAHFAILLPLQFLLLTNRLYRSLGSRTLLTAVTPSCGCKCIEKVPNADFVWVTKTVEEDKWLRDELRSLADGSSLNLHQFVTRQSSEEAERELSETNIFTQFCRPDLEKLFEKIANRTASGAHVGVFFCGPKAMGKDLKKSIEQVEVKSTLRGSYLGTLSDQEVREVFAIDDDDDVNRLRRFGCFVRFVFREENF